jgi:hypothetical protein
MVTQQIMCADTAGLSCDTALPIAVTISQKQTCWIVPTRGKMQKTVEQCCTIR